MNNIFLILTGIALGAKLLVVAKLFTEYRQVLTARILGFMMITSGCYLIQPFMTDFPNLLFVLQVGGMATPALFWMFAHTLFQASENSQKLHLGHYLGLVVCVGLGVVNCAEFAPTATIGAFLHTSSLVCTAVLVFLGLSDIFRNWQTDLVECRRLLRGGLAISAGTFLLFTVVNEFIYGHGQLPESLIYLNVVIISAFALGIAYLMLVSNANLLIEVMEELAPDIVKEDKDEPSLADKEWLEKLNHAMEIDLCYRKVDLTIRNLSEHLTIPEHQLRRLINQHLGYRNFNDYLNRYRVKDAAQRLTDPKLIRTPILTIAIESGYASLTTFNKAFKALKEMTPSEFRRTNGMASS